MRTMSVRLWMDRFLLLHALSLASAFASEFSHGATFGSHEMMAPKLECCRQEGMGRTQREDKEEKERKSVWEKGEKEKQPLQKPKTHKSKNNSFLSFLLFSLTSPFFLFFSQQKNKHPKTLKLLTNDGGTRRESTKCKEIENTCGTRRHERKERAGKKADARKRIPQKRAKSRGAS